MKKIYEDARFLADAGVAVIPVTPGKSPMLKGWRDKASTSIDDHEEWFGEHGSAAGVGVPCGVEQNLICFDLDFGHTDDQERKDKLQAWIDEHYNASKMMRRRTPSGGTHILCKWPKSGKPPRHIMPKFEVIIDGFQFIWSMSKGGYEYVDGVDNFEDLGHATPDMCRQVETIQGTGDGGTLSGVDEAISVIESNGAEGERHYALMTLTLDWMRKHPEGNVDQWHKDFEEDFRKKYGNRVDHAKMSDMFERGEVYRMWNKDLVNIGGPVSDKTVASIARKLGKTKEEHDDDDTASDHEWLTIDVNEVLNQELESIDWIVENSIPAGNVVSFAGPSGAGKTRYISLLMACMVSGRTDVVGLPVARRPVSTLYVANEERSSDIQRRVKAAAVANGLDDVVPQRMYVRGKEFGRFKMTTKDDGGHIKRNDVLLYQLAEQVIEKDIEFVIFDPFVTLGAGGESNPDEIDQVNSFMIELAELTGAAVGHVHHTPKDRSSMPDAERGLDGAWRGHGSIYSALDMGDTIFPYLPAAMEKKNLKRLADLQKSGELHRYVAVDSVKVREGHALPARVFAFSEAAVNSEGQMIGCLVPVPPGVNLDGEIMAMVKREQKHKDAKKKLEWARHLFDFAGGESGDHYLADIHTHMQSVDATGWSTNQRLYHTRTFGAEFLELMSSDTLVNNCKLRVEQSGVYTKIIIKKDK